MRWQGILWWGVRFRGLGQGGREGGDEQTWAVWIGNERSLADYTDDSDHETGKKLTLASVEFYPRQRPIHHRSENVIHHVLCRFEPSRPRL